MGRDAAEELRSSAYLTDGVDLLRVVDTVQGADAAVWLEDCRTLEREQVPVKVLLKRKLRKVIPASSVDS